MAICNFKPGLLGVTALLLCVGACQRKVSIQRNYESTGGSNDLIQAQLTEESDRGGVIVAMDLAQPPADDARLYGRRDELLSWRGVQSLAQADAWDPAPAPDITLVYPVYLPRNSDTVIFFRQERPRGTETRRFRQ